MSQYEYKRQDWQNYDDRLDKDTNIELGGVITPERMEHIEEGISHANMPTTYIISSGADDITNVTEEDGRRVVEIISSSVEPKHDPLNITIKPSTEVSTEVFEKDGKMEIVINTPSIEPRHPDKLEITLVPDKKDEVLSVDDGDTRKLLVKSTFLNTCAIKPAEREVVIDIEDWVEVEVEHFEAQINIEAEILPSSFVKFTKGLEITQEQLREIEFCGVQIIEKLDGTFIATARVAPTIDLPFHVSVL